MSKKSDIVNSHELIVLVINVNLHVQQPLGILLKSENDMEDMADILTELHRYIIIA